MGARGYPHNAEAHDRSWLSSDFRVLGHKKAPEILVTIAERRRVRHKEVTRDLTDASTQSTVILQGLVESGLAIKDSDGWWALTPRGSFVADHCRAILQSRVRFVPSRLRPAPPARRASR